MRSSHIRLIASSLFAPLLLCLAAAAQPQTTPASVSYVKPVAALPDTPNVVRTEPPRAKTTSTNDRILAILPDYGTVEYGQPTRSLSSFEKLHLATAGAYDFVSIPLVAGVAAVDQAKNSPRSWGQGWRAYGKRYGATFADNNIANILTIGIFPSALQEDPRYYRMGRGSISHRAFYSVSRLVIARTNSGHSRFNYSEFLGNAAAAGLSNVYHAPEDRSVRRNLHTYATLNLWDGAGNLMKEFWPDLHRKMQHKQNTASFADRSTR